MAKADDGSLSALNPIMLELNLCLQDLSRATHLMKQFPWAYTILNSIPPFILSFVHPLTERLFTIRSDSHLKIEQTRAALKDHDPQNPAPEKKKGEAHHPTVLHALLSNSSLPTEELLTPRLEDEAFTLLGAGTITTAHTLTTIMYYVLREPSIKEQLENELAGQYSCLPKGISKPDLKILEHCHYLAAVVSEGLRLSFGVSHRLPRISPDAALHYSGVFNGEHYDYTIPPGNPVSMTQMLIHLDPAIYPAPWNFEPQRWLLPDCPTEKEIEALRHRKHHHVPFSKGTRMCAGMHLAYAELYLMLGALFSPGGLATEMDLYETELEDIQCAHDFFNPSPKLNSDGVRVVLR